MPTKLYNSKVVAEIGEIVFGLEDGMVSTLGAITGIAVGSQNHFTVLLSGCVIIAVESVSMAIGSYISAYSEKDIVKRELDEERQEIKKFPRAEIKELGQMYMADGWPRGLASDMAKAASRNKKLMLKEMAYRELALSPDKIIMPGRNAILMFFAYVAGGLIPLVAYFIFPVRSAIYFSVICTLVGLFLLGILTARFSKTNWVKSGSRILILGGMALLVGYFIGTIANIINIK